MANPCSTGSVLCSISEPVKVTTLIEARIIVFGIEKPITTGLPVRGLHLCCSVARCQWFLGPSPSQLLQKIILHYQSVGESAKVKMLVSLLNRTSGEVIKRKPRFVK